MKKRLFCVILSLLMLAIPLVSCSENSDNSDIPVEETTTQTAETQAEATEEEDDTSTHYFDEQQAVDYDGWTLTIGNDELSTEYFSGFCADEITGEDFNDGLYNRQLKVEEKYNIELAESNNGSVTLIKSCVTAGSGDIGFGYVLEASCMGLITQDYVIPISSLPTVDFTKPYWDQGALQTLMMYGNMYYGYVDISFDHYESMSTLFYNGFLLEDNGIEESPYDLYMSGKWTLDAMYDMINVVVLDKNGDGQMDINHDIFGWAGREFEYLPSLYASNARLIKYNEETESYDLTINDENVMAIGAMLKKIILDTNISVPGRNDETRNLFKEGGCLFYSRLLGDFRNLRDKEDDYGIICYPSLEENTDGMVYVQNPYSIMIPSDCQDTERLGNIIEALGAYTYDNILDVYINKAVIGKGTRDEESAQILKEFIKIRAFDLNYAFGTTTVIDAYGVAVKGDTYASMQSKSEKSFNKTLSKAIEALKNE